MSEPCPIPEAIKILKEKLEKAADRVQTDCPDWDEGYAAGLRDAAKSLSKLFDDPQNN